VAGNPAGKISTDRGPERDPDAQPPRLGQKRTYFVFGLRPGEFFPVSGTRDQKIAAIAARQRGRVARQQLICAGIASSTVDRLLKSGFLHRLHQGVYAVGHLAPVELGRETAALLAARPGAVLSHLTAASLWNLRPQRSDGPVELTVWSVPTGRRAGIVVHRTSHLPSQDVRIFCGLPITSPARALADIAASLTTRELERALDEGLVRRIVRLGEVAEVVERLPNRPGMRALRNLLDHRRTTTLTRSQAEERFLELVRAAQLPVPEVNVPLHGFTVDFLWREQGVVVEVDGYRFHSTRSAFERDHRKTAVLGAAGLEVQRITWDQMDEESFAIVARLAKGLEARRAT
jgi:very-short-patch-repair endonuclease